ncbi:hypothetical protein [Formosa sp. PL04]|uniref:hypothetical protein n=1 Tax=Formosa sp. PL04 TaxID=3081755 RepID=UPI002982B6A8|nr:hypothetical protein [Formosa sp. PL04]MDW5288706.1 hypothetical protein [Formosa sp. PL04]
MEQKIKDSEILANVASALRLTNNGLATALEYKSPASIYHVINGVNALSKGMIDKIIKYFPNVNRVYLEKGEAPIILEGESLQTQLDFMNMGINKEFDLIRKFANLPDEISEIKELLISLHEKIDNK